MGGRSCAMEAMALSTTNAISRRFRLIRTSDLPACVCMVTWCLVRGKGGGKKERKRG